MSSSAPQETKEEPEPEKTVRKKIPPSLSPIEVILHSLCCQVIRIVIEITNFHNCSYAFTDREMKCQGDLAQCASHFISVCV